MEQWPFNGKSLWASLYPGQKWAVAFGIPIMAVMLNCYSKVLHLIIPCSSTPCKVLEMVLLAIGWPVVAWIYTQGIGFAIAVIVEAFFYRK